MSRRYADDRYDDRDRAYYDRRPRPEYDDLEVDIERERPQRRPRPRYDDLEIDIERDRAVRPARAASVVSESRRAPRQPEFLREDYGRDAAGPLVIREDDRAREVQRENGRTDISVAGSRRRERPARDAVDREEIVITDRVRDDVSVSGRSRKSISGRLPRDEEIIDDRRSLLRDRPRERDVREVDEERIRIRREEVDVSPPPRRKEFVEDDVRSRLSNSRPAPRREVEREKIVIQEERAPVQDERGTPDRDRGYESEKARRGPRMRHYGAPIAHEREEFVFRRRRSPSPPQDFEREQITIRRREASPPPKELTPEPEPEPVREPTPEPILEIVREPGRETVRELVRVRERSPDIPPMYRPPIVQHIYTHHHHIDHGLSRAQRSPSSSRSSTPPPPVPEPVVEPVKAHDESLEIEIKRRGVRNGQEFYEKDVIIERERDQIQRARSEVDLARRRSIASRPEGRRDSGRPSRREMWTEVTKDLVIKEAIEEAGYKYEVGPDHFFVMDYLQYEDVVRLVEITERMRKDDKEKIRDAKWRQEDLDRVSVTSGRPKAEVKERIIEREYVRDVRAPRRGERYR